MKWINKIFSNTYDNLNYNDKLELIESADGSVISIRLSTVAEGENDKSSS